MRSQFKVTATLTFVMLTANLVIAENHCHKDDGDCKGESEQQDEPLRLILVGKTGSGKSATGNTILGEKKFKVARLSKSVTQKAQLERTVIDGRTVEVMDSPDLFGTSFSPDALATEILHALVLMSPGPHAFLYVIQAGRYTQEDFDTYRRLKMLFENAENHMVIVFTHYDDLVQEGITAEEFMKDVDRYLRTVLNDCNERYVFLDNTSTYRTQILPLMETIQKLDGTPYRNKFSDAAEVVADIIGGIMNKGTDEEGEQRTRQKQFSG